MAERQQESSAKVVGWLVAVAGFVGSFLVREMMYVPWMLAIQITGESGRPTTANIVLALFFLAVQWGAIGYAVTWFISRRPSVNADSK